MDKTFGDTTEKYILIGAGRDNEDAAYASLDELSMLLETAGGECICEVYQRMDHPDPATYIRSGKAEEVREMVEAHEATGVICDDELSPAQIRNLTDMLDVKVIDRTILILDIFASHAHTNEGKLQVEMAQLKYRMSHLQGLGKSLSRLGGGIGTRGPGETKLESDRRRISKRIQALSKQIDHMKRMRDTTRKRRLNSDIPIIAIVGYTNAGKSSLLNRLTKSDILAEDKLFATLDPTTRKCRLPDGSSILLTDTVGFINKLPHSLVDAFRSTLEEARYSDALLHVVDASDHDMQMHIKVVYDTLLELGIEGKSVITVFNKVDLLEGIDSDPLYDPHADNFVRVSVRTGEGMESLIKELECLGN